MIINRGSFQTFHIRLLAVTFLELSMTQAESFSAGKNRRNTGLNRGKIYCLWTTSHSLRNLRASQVFLRIRFRKAHKQGHSNLTQNNCNSKNDSKNIS